MMKQTDFLVPTIDCELCARAITQALSPVTGIEQVAVNVRAKRVRVQYDPAQLDEAQVRDALESAGFAVEDSRSTGGQPS